MGSQARNSVTIERNVNCVLHCVLHLSVTVWLLFLLLRRLFLQCLICHKRSRDNLPLSLRFLYPLFPSAPLPSLAVSSRNPPPPSFSVAFSSNPFLLLAESGITPRKFVELQMHVGEFSEFLEQNAVWYTVFPNNYWFSQLAPYNSTLTLLRIATQLSYFNPIHFPHFCL